MLPEVAAWSWDLRPLRWGGMAVPVATSGVGGVLPQAADLFLVYVLGIFVALSIARNVLYNPPAKAPTRKPPAKKGSTPPSRGKKSMV